MKTTGGVASIHGTVSGYIQGDDSLGFSAVDMSYMGEEKYDIMSDDVITFDAVYAGLDGSLPTFIALDMNLQ